MTQDWQRQPESGLKEALQEAVRLLRHRALEYRNSNGAKAFTMDKTVRKTLAATYNERARLIEDHVANLQEPS